MFAKNINVEDVTFCFTSTYILKEVEKTNLPIQWPMLNVHPCLEFLLSASPALLRNHELCRPQEIQQTLNRRKSYRAFGKCSEQCYWSPAAKHCSRDRRSTGGNYWQSDTAKYMSVEPNMAVSLTGGTEHKSTLWKTQQYAANTVQQQERGLCSKRKVNEYII